MRAAPSGGPRALAWLFAIQLVSMGAMDMSAPFWPLHLRALGGLSPQALAWASSAAYAGPMLMALVCTPFWGRLGDRIGHRTMVLRALVALAATQALIALSDSVALVLAARLVQGALGGFIAAAQAYGASQTAPERRGRLMAQLQVATAIGSSLGPVAGGLLYAGSGFIAVNAVAAVACLLCALLAAIVLPSDRVVGPAPCCSEATVPTDARLAPLRGLLLGIVLVQTARMMPQAFFGLYAEQVLHVTPVVSGFAYGALPLGVCIAAPLWGRWFERQDVVQVLRRIEAICWACAALVALQAFMTSPTLFIAVRFAWGIGLGALLPVFYALLSRQAGTRQGAVLGAGNGAAKAGALVGTAAGGLLIGMLPVQHLFWPVAAVYVIAALGLALLREAKRFPLFIEEKNES